MAVFLGFGFTALRATKYGLWRWSAMPAAVAGLAGWAVASSELGWILRLRTHENASVLAGLCGFLLGFLVLYLQLRRRMPLGSLADWLLPPCAIALLVYRFGCMLAGCGYGLPTELPWGVTLFDGMALAWYGTPLGVRLHPTQLYECGMIGVMLALLFLFERRMQRTGLLSLYIVSIYAAGRFLIDFLRDHANQSLPGPLSIAQWICLAVLSMASGVALLSRHRTTQSRAAQTALKASPLQ